jgi:hypothetical protein
MRRGAKVVAEEVGEHAADAAFEVDADRHQTTAS